jgi:hypothetical protein
MKSYEKIKEELLRVKNEEERLCKSNLFNDETESQLDRLDTIQVVFNWLLNDENDTHLV